MTPPHTWVAHPFTQHRWLRGAWPLARYTLLEALRMRLVALLLAMIAVALAASAFIGAATITDSQATQTVIVAAGLRLTTTLLVLLLTVQGIDRERADRSISLWLAMPIPRAAWYLGRLLGLTLIASMVAAAAGIALWLIHDSDAQALASTLRWALGLLAELWLVVLLAMFFANTLRAPALASCAVLFALGLGRIMPLLLDAAASPSLDQPQWLSQLIAALLMVIDLVVPPVATLASSGWLIDEPVSAAWVQTMTVSANPALASQLASVLGYALAVACATLVDLYRRDQA